MAEGPLVVGVDIGGTNMQFGVVGPDGSMTGRARAKTEAELGLDRVVANLVRGVRDACAEAGVELEDLSAVGVASAGAIDMPRGVILESPNLGWTDVPLRDILKEKLGRPVVLDNDVNGAVWGEYRLGAARGAGDVLGVWVGTGIGGGLVLKGAVYHGDAFTAGEIGHTVIVPDGPPGRRKLEDLCSRTGMRRTIRDQAGEHPGSRLAAAARDEEAHIGTSRIAGAYREGDPLAVAVIERAADLLGVAIANWITVLSLQTVIVGGGITEALGEPYLRLVARSVRDNVFPQRLADCKVAMTELAADSGLLGAALLAADHARSERGSC